MPLTKEQRDLALKCWKDSVCETGHGTLTVAYADGFGENVWRQVTAMEYIEQALTYPDVKKIIYTSARGDASCASPHLVRGSHAEQSEPRRDGPG